MTFSNVFITGASSGLGRGLALHYARAGSTVFAVARRKEQLESLAAEAGAAGGGKGRIVPIVLDVTDLEAQVAAQDEARREAGGHLDLVIANAGTNLPQHASRLDWRKVQQVLNLNLNAACATIAAALPSMCARGSGTVVGVSSLAAFRGLPSNAAYCASKAALGTFLESIRVDLTGTDVRALCIYPGFVKTELTARHKEPMPFLMELDDAVRVMARGIERGEAQIAFPLPLSAALKVASALPDGLYTALAGRMAPKPKKRTPV
jgi:short-subunit dehydrogenase